MQPIRLMESLLIQEVIILRVSSNENKMMITSNTVFKSHGRNREECPTYGKVCKKCNTENHVASKCHLHEKKTSSKKMKPKASKSSSKETFRKKVSLVETDLSSEEEILSVELSTEDESVSTSEVINSVSDFPNKIYVVMEKQGKPARM